MKKQKLFFTTLLTILSAVLLLTAARIFAGDSTPSENLLLSHSLQLSQFPAGSRLVNSGFIPVNDPAQPLNSQLVQTTNQASSADLLAYTVVYRMGVMVPGQKSDVYVGHYLYEYPSAAVAQKATAQLATSFLQLPDSQTVTLKNNPVQGQAVMVLGDEGDLVYWLISSQENVVSLLMVNGLNEPAIETIFQELMSLIK